MRRAALVFLLLACAASAAAAPLKVCLYFDGEDNAAGFHIGERSAIMVRNLLGHFKEVEVSASSLAGYRSGGLAGCQRAIYMGTYFEAKLPAAFLADAAAYRSPLLWMNYNIWKLQEKLGGAKFEEQWGFAYRRVDDATTPAPPEKIPHFYREFTYKGATFRKVAQLDGDGRLHAHPHIVLVANRSASVLSEGIHSGTGARTPYALRKGERFYIADNPVSVIDERDRYLILADLLFDFLKLEPRSKKRYALARIEDVDPAYDLKLLYLTIEVFRARKVPFAISLIPRHVGPNGALDLTENLKFARMIRYAVANGASILMHGYEHRLTVDLGCGVSYSGEGYEFWDGCNNAPLPFESAQLFQDKLDKAKKILHEAKIPYVGWVTPHYAASPLALRVIDRNFGRMVQQMTYFVEGRPLTAPNAIDQFFPYPIVRDHYGFHIWPENLGYVPLPEQGGTAQHVDGMLEAARLHKVVRDAWASFFWHPPLIRTEIGLQSLEKLVDGIRAQGYEFVSLTELRKRGE
jgi:uncharacterized protein YdaL